jgi:type I restriction enzyme S subunit
MPHGWRWVEANDVMDVRDGTHDSPKSVATGIPLVTSKNLVDGNIDFSTCSFISKLDHDAISKRSAVDNGDILYAMIGTIGNPVIVEKECEFSIKNVALFKFTKTNQVHNRFFYHFLNSNLAIRQFQSNSRGGTQKFVSLGNIRGLQIPLPPLEEQKRIAAILDKADAIRRKRQQSIQLADDFLRSVFLDMFGDPVSNPKGWEVRKFADIGTLDRGKSKHRPRNDPALLGGTHPLIQTGDVAKSKGYIKNFKSTYSELGLQQSRKWPAGTLCITIAANIAKTGILTFDACFPDSVVGFNPNKKATTEYVQIWIGFLQKILEASAPESAQKNINLAILRDLDIPIPPIDLQQKYSEIVGSIVSINEKYDISFDVKEDFFNSISQRAFAGKL